jgi:hypothetical protein
MRIKFLYSIFLFSCIVFSQENQNNTANSFSANELKLNLIYTLSGYPEISYERLLTKETGVGVSMGISLDDSSISSQEFNINPYYRFYFGKGEASGFFIETNGAFYSEEAYSSSETKRSHELGLGLGIALGSKFLSNTSGWLGEFHIGGGRNFINNDKIGDAYPRFGLSLGKRF